MQRENKGLSNTGLNLIMKKHICRQLDKKAVNGKCHVITSRKGKMSASKGNNKGGVFARKQGVCNGGNGGAPTRVLTLLVQQ